MGMEDIEEQLRRAVESAQQRNNEDRRKLVAAKKSIEGSAANIESLKIQLAAKQSVGRLAYLNGRGVMVY